LGLWDKAEVRAQRAIWNVAGCWIEYDDLEEYFHGLAELFYEEKDGLLQLYEQEVRPTAALLLPVFTSMSGMPLPRKILHILRIFRAMSALSKSRSASLMEGDVLARYLRPDGRAYAFLVEKEDEVDYRGEMTFMTKVGKWQTQTANVYPAIGFQGVADEMAALFETHGGEVRTCASVSHILIENGRAVGVDVEVHGKKETIYARNIVCCLDLKRSLRQLVGYRYLNVDLVERLEKTKLSRAIPILYLGVNIPPEVIRSRFHGRDEVLFFPTLQPARDGKAFFKNHEMVVHSSCFHNPAHAPAGKTNLHVYLSCPPDGWMENWGLVDGMRTDRYREIKEMVIADCLVALQELIPELGDRSKIEVCELGTPFTLERYTGNTEGSCLGYRMDADYINSKKFGAYFDRCPGVTHLFFAGQQTGYPGGLINAFKSGEHAGKLV
jgi:phytoene dehydrogenase-like protein